jgi:5-bromo-4-chloroindolyl phosphate hydrolysis protein
MMVTHADIAFLEQLILGSTGVIVVLFGSILGYVVRRLGKLETAMLAGFAEMRAEFVDVRKETSAEFVNVRKDISNLAADIAFIRGQLAPRPEQTRRAEG